MLAKIESKSAGQITVEDVPAGTFLSLPCLFHCPNFLLLFLTVGMYSVENGDGSTYLRRLVFQSYGNLIQSTARVKYKGKTEKDAGKRLFPVY